MAKTKTAQELAGMRCLLSRLHKDRKELMRASVAHKNKIIKKRLQILSDHNARGENAEEEVAAIPVTEPVEDEALRILDGIIEQLEQDTAAVAIASITPKQFETATFAPVAKSGTRKGIQYGKR